MNATDTMDNGDDDDDDRLLVTSLVRSLHNHQLILHEQLSIID